MVQMSTAAKRPIWIASGSVVNGIRTFAAPIKSMWNWRSLSSKADLMAFGPDYKDYRRAVTTNKQVDNLKEFDRVWMDATPSDISDPLAKDAQFYVESITVGVGGTAVVMFRRLKVDG